MNTLFLASNGGNGNLMMIVMLVILVAVTYFGMIRPQRKQQQRRAQMMDTLKKGDRVVLVDGLHGKIDSINNHDKTVVIDADGILLTFSRLAVRQVLPHPAAGKQKAVGENKGEAAKPQTTEAESATSEQETQPSEPPKQAPKKADDKEADDKAEKSNKADD